LKKTPCKSAWNAVVTFKMAVPSVTPFWSTVPTSKMEPTWSNVLRTSSGAVTPEIHGPSPTLG
jgi:hypothetical protein